MRSMGIFAFLMIMQMASDGFPATMDVVEAVQSPSSENGSIQSQISTPLRCVIHVTVDQIVTTEKVTLFKNDTLNTCQSILKFRKECNLKYSDFLLPEKVDDFNGFHMKCYRTFTALSPTNRNKMKEMLKAQTSSTENITLRSSTRPSSSSSTTGVFDKSCIFCEKGAKKRKGEKQPLIKAGSKEIEKCIYNYAVMLNDSEMKRKLEIDENTGTIIDFVAKEVHYHAMCRGLYQKRAERYTRIKPNDSWHKIRDAHKTAFEEICKFVEEFVIEKKESYLIHQLTSHYRSVLLDIDYASFKDITFQSQELEKKLLGHFTDKIKVDGGNKKRGNIIYNATMDSDAAARKAYDNDKELHLKLRDAACELRKHILNAERRRLPDTLRLSDIYKGEMDPPNLLVDFINFLISGPVKKQFQSDSKKRRVDSICQDIIFSTTNGLVKPSKHLQMGIAMKSLTGSRKILEILNRLGHSVSYHVAEELETELTISSGYQQQVTPHGMHLSNSLSTGLAFDNYDRYIETNTGKDTLHDTVGIAYQDACEEPVSEDVFQSTSFSRKRRRTINAMGLELEPYRKRPKMSSSPLLPLKDLRRRKVPASYQCAVLYDTIWMLSLYYDPDNTPMWVGWNAKVFQQEEVIQKIWYLPQINLSPTSNTVILQTMKSAQKVAEECDRQEIAVTYDLAIAKPALQIQAEESPKFDNVFIMLGSFHIELAFFHAIGKYIAESGGPTLLTECGVIASGSLSGLLSGKHYNRCKRIHALLAVSMELMHFRSFLKSIENSGIRTTTIKENLLDIQQNTGGEIIILKELNDLCDLYLIFKEKTINGSHGKTAEFWIKYSEYIHLYHELSRSVRGGDFELYCFSLQRLCHLFFALNQQNYARWLVRYHDNLLKINETHPHLAEEFKKGKFGIRRTNKNFSRSPIDLTLEQTVNGDAANQHCGVTQFTNSIAARQRWAQSHYLRTSVITNLMQNLDLNKNDDVTSDLKICKIKRNCNSLKSILSHIEETMDPFSDMLDKNMLYNITTGKSASPSTEKFLLMMKETGQRACDNFIDACSKDPHRFEERISRVKISNFASENVKMKPSSKGKSDDIRMERNIFGQLLCYAVDKKIDIAEVMTYPLSPIPLCLCHTDGTKHTTKKDKLVKILEKKVVSLQPTHIDYYVVDGMFFLRQIGDIPILFGDIAELVLRKLCAYSCEQIYLIFDRYVSPSIKDIERDLRSCDRETSYEITGPMQKRPNDFLESLRKVNFKEAFISFLAKMWQHSGYADIISSKQICLTTKQSCYSYRCVNGAVIRKEEHEMYSEQEEADYRIMFHISLLSTPGNVVVRADDTDVLIILLGNLHIMSPEFQIWMELGHFTKNNLRFVDVSNLYRTLGPILSRSLPGFHAFTGCDFTASFLNKGKQKPFTILEKNVSVQQAFGSLGRNECIDDELVTQIGKFVCQIYGGRDIVSIDDLRLEMFLKAYKPKGGSLQNIKGQDGSNFPPCTRTLVQKIKRCNYICSLWLNAAHPGFSNISPTSSGWKLDNGKYAIHWFDGEYLPSSIELADQIEEEPLENYSYDSDSDSSESDNEGQYGQ